MYEKEKNICQHWKFKTFLVLTLALQYEELWVIIRKSLLSRKTRIFNKFYQCEVCGKKFELHLIERLSRESYRVSHET